MPKTYQPIATTTLGSAAASITFSSIPSSYTDLVFVIQLSSTSTDNIFVRFNSDTASNYSVTRLAGPGSNPAVSDRQTSQTMMTITRNGYPTTTNGNTVSIMQVMNYANATTNKTALIRSNDAGNGTDAIVGLWRKTPEAINAVSFSTNSFGAGTSISTGSTITLYGIKAA